MFKYFGSELNIFFLSINTLINMILIYLFYGFLNSNSLYSKCIYIYGSVIVLTIYMYMYISIPLAIILLLTQTTIFLSLWLVSSTLVKMDYKKYYFTFTTYILVFLTGITLINLENSFYNIFNNFILSNQSNTIVFIKNSLLLYNTIYFLSLVLLLWLYSLYLIVI